MTLVFGDPPPRCPSSWRERLKPLMEHPGRWVDMTATYGIKPGHDIVSKLRYGKVSIPDGEWSFTGRNLRTPDAVLWARFDGPSPARFECPEDAA